RRPFAAALDGEPRPLVFDCNFLWIPACVRDSLRRSATNSRSETCSVVSSQTRPRLQTDQRDCGGTGMTRRILFSAFAALISLMVLPSQARAQSAIAGTVKDPTGAVLPGVTVEASSDVLIEKTRSVVTNGQGQFTIVDLRPGVYSLAFSLPGFSGFKRDGIELPG